MGIPIRVHASWFLILALMVYGLAVGPLAEVADLPAALCGGLVVALALFASVTLHELGHSAVARELGIGVRSITLFLFGGVAEIVGEPRRVRDEIAIALAGPAVSFLLALLLLPFAGERGLVPRMFQLLAFANFSVGSLNMLPALPLDGGRVLRALFWGITGDYGRATSLAAGAGLLLGAGVIALGLSCLLVPFPGARGSGVWFILIGIFLARSAWRARAQGRIQARLRAARVGEVARRFGRPFPADTPVGRAAPEIARGVAVVGVDGALGFADAEMVDRIPPERWETITLSEVAHPIQRFPALDIEEPLDQAMTLLATTGSPRALVFHGRDLVGVLSRSDLARWLFP